MAAAADIAAAGRNRFAVLGSVPGVTTARDDVVARLRAAGCVFAEDEAGLLCAAADSPADLDALVERRVDGTPLEQLLGWAEFRGLRIAVAPGVFVPRRRTGLLAARATALAPAGGVAVDLCCGSGAVAAALAAERPDLEVHAADLDPAAVACARRNVRPDRVHAGDLFAALPPGLRGRVAVLAVNAPYVPSDEVALMPPEARDHEPRGALDGGPDGLDVQRRVAAGAPQWLTPGGHLLVETSRRQAGRTASLFAAAGLRPSVVRDDDLGATVVAGRRAPDRR